MAEVAKRDYSYWNTFEFFHNGIWVALVATIITLSETLVAKWSSIASVWSVYKKD